MGEPSFDSKDTNQETSRTKKIGFFDSGIGGFTLLSAVRSALPHYDYLYYGDTAHVPYGDRTEEEVYELTKRGVETLIEQEAALIIVACNTASAKTLRRLQDELIPHVYEDVRILGVIIPTVERLLEYRGDEALLIATKRTVDSNKYDDELRERKASFNLTSVATPGLVPLLEADDLDGAMHYLEEAIGDQIGKTKVLVLACTHYVLLKDRLRQQYPGLVVISQDEIIPEKLMLYIQNHPEIAARLRTSTEGTLTILLTKDDAAYRIRLQKMGQGR